MFREIIANLVKSIEGGKTLSQAMALHPNAFDKIFISLTHAGEESGRLVEVFKHLTESLKWQDEMATQTKNMMIYPLFVGSVVLGITFFLMIYLVPQLVGFIKGMGMEIPFQTRLLLATSSIFVNYWYVILFLPVLLFGAFKGALILYPSLQYHVDKLKLNIWPTGPILKKIILARFANTFAMMYASGITILDCLANSKELANNQVIARSMEQVIKEIEAGENLLQSNRPADKRGRDVSPKTRKAVPDLQCYAESKWLCQVLHFSRHGHENCLSQERIRFCVALNLHLADDVIDWPEHREHDPAQQYAEDDRHGGFYHDLYFFD